MAEIDKKVNDTMQEFIDFIDLRYKGLVITDQFGKIVKVNDRFLEIFHLNTSDGLEIHLEDLNIFMILIKTR